MAVAVTLSIVRDRFAASKDNVLNNGTRNTQTYTTPVNKLFQTQYITSLDAVVGTSALSAASSVITYAAPQYFTPDRVFIAETVAAVSAKIVA